MVEFVCKKCGKVRDIHDGYIYRMHEDYIIKHICKHCRLPHKNDEYTIIPYDTKKYCQRCKKLLPLTDYGFQFRNVDIRYVYRHCKICRREMAKEYYRKNKPKYYANKYKWESQNKHRCKNNTLKKFKKLSLKSMDIKLADVLGIPVSHVPSED